MKMNDYWDKNWQELTFEQLMNVASCKTLLSEIEENDSKVFITEVSQYLNSILFTLRFIKGSGKEIKLIFNYKLRRFFKKELLWTNKIVGVTAHFSVDGMKDVQNIKLTLDKESEYNLNNYLLNKFNAVKHLVYTKEVGIKL